MSKIKAELDANQWESTDPSTGAVTYSFAATRAELSFISEKLEYRWKMLHTKLHSTAFILDPMMHDKHNFDGDCMAELYEYLEMVTALHAICLHASALWL